MCSTIKRAAAPWWRAQNNRIEDPQWQDCPTCWGQAIIIEWASGGPYTRPCETCLGVGKVRL